MASVDEYVKRIEVIGQPGSTDKLVAVLTSRNPVTYDFYLKKPFFPIGLSHHYRTAVRVILTEEGDQTIVKQKTISPPFIFIAVAILLFFIIFDWMIVKTPLNITRLIAGIILIGGTSMYHSFTASKIREELESRILFFD